ncbi:uncharacterized protein AKAW2_50320S [Aspergillus luchuensis]|uniref:C2H2-type domain-containing protein n=1 Tax=Aspergillus kawachii TaxID=1069201 RepID=A0A7R7ZYX9_ASPKA|nr:uncharacterized protein AKAW2_50320S [Aspergillus luchuensis]BCR99978.1 hypothetical protein AKAW2_50320S [Aspergillus luchuensis]GAA92367.1 hypothetical protein AKAW_10481 [Aspergillus luchuensis IFO 4308]
MNPQEQTFMCTAKECTKIFTSIDDWRMHVGEYSFEKGHICLYDDCGELIPTAPDELRAHQCHLYLDHKVNYNDTEELAESFIEKNFYSVEEGRIWCSACRRMLELDNREEALQHFERHVSDRSQIEIPGQTKYPKTDQMRKEMPGASARLANEGEGNVVDLSQRGTFAWIDSA